MTKISPTHHVTKDGVVKRNPIRQAINIKEEKELMQVVNQLKKYPGVNEIVLYGSRTGNNYRPDSDYDILVFVAADVEWPSSYYDEIFKLPNKYDIKLVEDQRSYGDIVWMCDRRSWLNGEEQGTPMTVDVIVDETNIVLWKR